VPVIGRLSRPCRFFCHPALFYASGIILLLQVHLLSGEKVGRKMAMAPPDKVFYIYYNEPIAKV